MIRTFDYNEGKKTNIILQESNILAILIFQTSMVVLYGCWFILTAPIAPLLTGHLWGYCTSNAMTTFDRQSIPGILEVRSGVPLHKIE